MPRPTRCRRICREPAYDRFAPCGTSGADPVQLTVDEFETIRIIDWERQTHEACAGRMGVSRTTVTEMYERARVKLADCLVNGRPLCIAGGHYELCDGSARRQCGKACHRFFPANEQIPRKEETSMRIAVTYENGKIFQHFGHTEQFKLYDVEDGAVRGTQLIPTTGSGHGALAGLLSRLGVDTLICGGIGAGAQMALTEAGIRLYGGVNGGADEAVAALLAGTLAYQPDIRCEHHDHGAGHDCGEGHHCGEEKHGCPGNGEKCH